MVPPPGVPARFGFSFLGVTVYLDAHLEPGPTYRLSVAAANTSEALQLAGSTVTFWGVPASPAHDHERQCPGAVFGEKTGEEGIGHAFCESSAPQSAFLRMPTSCTPPGQGLQWDAHMDSWVHPGRLDENGFPDTSDPNWVNTSFQSHEQPGFPLPPSEWGATQGTDGCDLVPFTPTISIQPTSHQPDSPSGLDVTLQIPQEALTNPGQIAQADLKKTVVTLPAGMTVNPSRANGLGACSPQQIGLTNNAQPTCPDSSKIGTVEIETPVLPEPLQGSVYLATQNENPFHSLFAVYIVVQANGVIVKLPGRVDLDPVTGQLTTTFENTPQLPFSKLRLVLSSGSRAALLTPASCGEKKITAELTGWNEKRVAIENGYDVSCAPGIGGFAPSFTAGTTDNLAGAYSPMTLAFGRNDGEQLLTGLTETLAPGLLAKLAGVTHCGDAEASTGNCPEASRIGAVTVAAGAGDSPVALHGTVYLTGPYNGGPFGAAVVVPAVVGPFDLGNVVVRASIRIDPRTAQASIVSDPFPRFVGGTGIPTDIRRVEVNLDRPQFALNPTNCDPLQVTGTLTGSQGASASVASRFQAADCGALGFAPRFSASTSAAVSRSDGATLNVTVAYPKGAQANIRSVKVKLPRQLASRLTTLQQACPAATFAANPASCPAGSLVGSATARSPILAAALSGPAYFVSHGGAKFPELVIVLQGESVTIELGGETFIDEKTNITSSAFRSVPDAPISSFRLSLPRGPHSALGSGANLCKVKLAMPTVITAQDGAVIKQSTRIAVSGCAKHKRTHAKAKHGKRK
jgi:hypothetical protein